MPEVSNNLLETSHTFKKGETLNNGLMSGTIKHVGLHSIFIEVAGCGTVQVAKSDFRSGNLFQHIFAVIKEKKVEKEQNALQAKADECNQILEEEHEKRKGFFKLLGELRDSIRKSKNQMDRLLRSENVTKYTDIKDESTRNEYLELMNSNILDEKAKLITDAKFGNSIGKSRGANSKLQNYNNQMALWETVRS
ncbi:MAG: hypothetical protein MJ231_07505 [bacterium]|nr:hypothetical protein [bacterium]